MPTALITGATDGVGRLVARQLAAKGFRVMVHGRSRDRGASLVHEIEAAGGKGAFHEYEPPEGLNGHQISSAPALWTGVLEAYLAARGLPAKPAP